MWQPKWLIGYLKIKIMRLIVHIPEPGAVATGSIERKRNVQWSGTRSLLLPVLIFKWL